MDSHTAAAKKLSDQQDTLLLKLLPALKKKYDSIEWNVYAPHLLKYITRSVKTGDANLTAHYLSWLNLMLKSRLHQDNLSKAILDRIGKEIHRNINSKDGQIIDDTLESIKTRISDFPADYQSVSRLDLTLKHGNLAHLLFDFLKEGDRNAATLLLKDAIQDGIPVMEIYLDVLQPCLEEAGRLWALNKLSIAQEHFITASVQAIMSQLTPFIFNSDRNGKKLVAAAVSEGLHEIGIRMVADIFEMEGWDTLYLGGNIPIDEIVGEVRRTNPELLALSVTLGAHLDDAEEIIRKIRSEDKINNVKIMVGGQVINENPELRLTPEPDLYAYDLKKSLEWANNIAK